MSSKKQYKVITSSHKVVFTGDYCQAMDQVVLAKNAIIVSVIGGWVIAQSKRGVFSVIDEPHQYTKPSIAYRYFVATFTALESFYGAGNMFAGESFQDRVFAKDRNHAMRVARQMWRETNGGPFGVKAKISVKLES